MQFETGTMLRRGDSGDAVRHLQELLSAAGYRIGVDGQFGPGTDSALRRFQAQHGMKADGIFGPETANLLSGAPPDKLVAQATPLVVQPQGHPNAWPHDDTASLLAFYGKPWADGGLLTNAPVPFRMTYEGALVRGIRCHVKVAPALTAALAAVWDAYGRDQAALEATHLTRYSGAYNYRPIRGSSRLSCHAFGAAVDFDAEHLPLGRPNPPGGIPAKVVDIFKAHGAFWGGEYISRKDPMHFQWAHEG